jgi:hypothetical protein
MSQVVAAPRRTVRRRRQPSSESPTSTASRKSSWCWSKKQTAPADVCVVSRIARS